VKNDGNRGTVNSSCSGHTGISTRECNVQKVYAFIRVLGTVSWVAEGCMLVDFLPRKETGSVVCHIYMLQKL
jgi:hypothetical protein